MQDDPAQYWQDLTENYRQMSDGELLELSAKPEDLTEIARQVLRDEMDRRKIEARKPSEPTVIVLLCDCESNDQAWYLFEKLKSKGIESWVREVTAASADVR